MTSTDHTGSDAKTALGGSDAHQAYLDLLKRCLTNMIYGDTELMPANVMGKGIKQRIINYLKTRGILLMRHRGFDPVVRAEGRDWSLTAHTMVGLKRLDNVQACAEKVLADNVPGDFVETGVWRGGTTIFMRAILNIYGVTDRTVWVCDSFEGLPPPDADNYPADKGSAFHEYEMLAVSVDRVKSNFAAYGLLDDQVKFVKGWFSESLPKAPIEKVALLRLDGDMYESTMDAIKVLYPKLSVGGFVIVDDYGSVPACRQAIHDYREQHGIDDEISMTECKFGAYWRRSR